MHPIIDHFEHAAHFTSEDDAGERLRKLRGLLVPSQTYEQDLVRFTDLLAIQSEALPKLAMSPQRKKTMMFAAFAGQLEAVASVRPVLMVFEDAHWSDPTSRELLDDIINSVHRLPLLLLITHRPEFNPPWIGRAEVTFVTVGRLDGRQAITMAANIRPSSDTLPTELLQRIAMHSDGVPLFIEELTKSVLETGMDTAGEAVSLSVPGTLRASLMARLDRLPAAKQVAQIGAAIGREFSQELLAAVTSMSPTQLIEALDELVASGKIRRLKT